MCAVRRLAIALALLVPFAIPCSLVPADGSELPPPRHYAASEASGAELAAAVDFFARHSAGLTPSQLEQTARCLVVESRRAGLSPALVLAVIEVESAGDTSAVSPAGALGLMQLLPGTAEAVADRIGMPWRGPEMLFDPVANVRLGVRYLAELRHRFGTISTALAAYNWGPTHIARRQRGGEALPVVYPRRVLRAYGRLLSEA